MDTIALLGSMTGLGLMAGLRLYATVVGIGLGVRFGFIELHPSMSHLAVLAEPYVLAPAGIAYIIEFFADKIPWVDSLWDSFHTFIRPVGAAILGATAIGAVDNKTAVGVMLLTGGMALSGHATKAGARLLVNYSPEPFSNIALSMAEDAFAIFGTWLAMEHPLVMFGIVAAFLAVFLWLGPKVWRLLKVQWTALKSLLHRSEAAGDCVRCAAGRGVRRLRNSIGLLCVTGEAAVFTARRAMRSRTWELELNRIEDVTLDKHTLMDKLTLRCGSGERQFFLFKGQGNAAERLIALLRRASDTRLSA